MKQFTDELVLYLQEIKERALRATYINKKYPILYENINTFSKKENIIADKFSEKVFLYVYGISKKGICVCGKYTEFLSYNRGYRNFCGYKCSNNDESLTKQKVSKYKSNLLEKYGTDNIWNVKGYREKVELTLSTKDYSEIVENLKNTIRKKYNVENISQLDSIKKKKEDVYFAKTGYKNPYSDPIIKKKISETNLKLYGFKNPLKNENILQKLKNTVQLRYGVDNVMKNDEIKEIVKKTYLKNWGETHFKYSKIYQKDRIEKHIINLNQQHIDFSINVKILSWENTQYNMICDKCNENFTLSVNMYNIRKNNKFEICTVCNPIRKNISLGENSLKNFIETLYENTTKIRLEKKEFDIYCEEKKLAIEYNGVYWHSEEYVDKYLHKKKKEIADKHSIRLIHVWEDDWLYKQNIVKSMLSNIFNNSEKIYARNCELKIVTSKESKEFLNVNHIFGWCVSSHRLGLYYQGELVSLMTFGKNRISLGKKSEGSQYELLRYCNKLNTSVTGGASKLLKNFIKEFKPTKIISYANRDYSEGNLYEKIGFKFVTNTSPGYHWVVNGLRKNRFNYRKDILVKQGHDPNMTETEIMHSLGHWRIWNSGNKLYELVL